MTQSWLDRKCPPGFICIHEHQCPGAANPPEPPPVAHEAISDQQLHDLMDALLIENMGAILGADYRECKLALGLLAGTTKKRQQEARQHCADLIESRKAAQP